MMRRETRRHYAASPAETYAAIVDWTNWLRWRPYLKEVGRMTDDAITTATAWTEVHEVHGRPFEIFARAIEVDPPHTFSFNAQAPGFSVTFRWSVRWDDERTAVTQTVSVQSRGLRHLLQGTQRAFLDRQDAALDELRVHLNQTTLQTRMHT